MTTLQTPPESLLAPLVGIPNPERYAPGSAYRTHPWDETNPMWDRETGLWCVACGAASWKDDAFTVCPGGWGDYVMPPSAVIYAPAALRDDRPLGATT